MISLNDYLYSGHTVLSILHLYEADLRRDAELHHNSIDLAHCNFLLQVIELLENNYFLTDQSQRIQEFYTYLSKEYPYLAFTFKGRIKSLIRSEEKFNGYLVEFIGDYYERKGVCPTSAEIKQNMKYFRDLIAYRIVIQIPRCHLKPGENAQVEEEKILYRIANILPDFLEHRGFTAELSGRDDIYLSPSLNDDICSYYRDYIVHPASNGYQSLHITFYDNRSRNYIEIQLRTKRMDDMAEIGAANHRIYEEEQANIRTNNRKIPEGLSIYYDEALERTRMLQHLDLASVDVNMFSALDNKLINDGCGLFRGRLILPFEHLSLMQSDDKG